MESATFTRKNFFGSRPDEGPPSTIRRLSTSRHLRDLQLVAVVSLITFVISGILFFAPIVIDVTGAHQNEAGQLAYICPAQERHDATMSGIGTGNALYVCTVQKSGVAPTPFGWVSSAIFNAMSGALLAAAAAALNWVYQTGSRRLGAVDLFGCEISAICRVCLIVDFAQKSVDQHKEEEKQLLRSAQSVAKGSDDDAAKFTSEEHYTPVYDNNLSDLQPLDVSAVTFVTQFYTYRKTMMDFLRRIAVTKALSPRLDLMDQMIYLQFLMYESAREAVEVLIEFEPNQAESLINVLCSELVLYRFLLRQHSNDYRTRRLRLRIADYARVVPLLLDMVAEYGHLPHWHKAQATARVLVNRYEDLSSAAPELPALTPRQNIP